MDSRARLERVIVDSDAAIARFDGVTDLDARAVVLDALIVKGEAPIDLRRYVDARVAQSCG